MFEAQWDVGLPGALAMPRLPACGLNGASVLSQGTLQDAVARLLPAADGPVSDELQRLRITLGKTLLMTVLLMQVLHSPVAKPMLRGAKQALLNKSGRHSSCSSVCALRDNLSASVVRTCIRPFCKSQCRIISSLQTWQQLSLQMMCYGILQGTPLLTQDAVEGPAAARFACVLVRIRRRLAALLNPPDFKSDNTIAWHGATAGAHVRGVHVC